jgi:hypothetical protein
MIPTSERTAFVADVEARLVEVARIRVLHHELADADEPAAGARFVTELGLEVVHDHRQLAIALDDVAQQDRHDLLVGHRQDHVALAPVLEPHELRADLREAPALLPHLGRVDDGHLHLLPTDRVDLLADDLLHAVVDPLAQRQQRIDARPELADVAGTDQQPMRRHLGISRIVAERGEEQGGQTHGRTRIAALRPDRAAEDATEAVDARRRDDVAALPPQVRLIRSDVGSPAGQRPRPRPRRPGRRATAARVARSRSLRWGCQVGRGSPSPSSSQRIA